MFLLTRWVITHPRSFRRKAFITATVISHAYCCRTGSMAAEEGMLGGGLGAKLKCPTPISRLRVEKIEGGLMVAGVVIAANCQIALPAFGTLFMLVGAVLTGSYFRFLSFKITSVFFF